MKPAAPVTRDVVEGTWFAEGYKRFKLEDRGGWMKKLVRPVAETFP